MSEPVPAPLEKNALRSLRDAAARDSDGGEKKILSLHDRLFARFLAPPVAWLCLKLGLSADFVTALSLLTGFAGAGLFVCGTMNHDLAAVALLQLSYLLDCVDGDLARVRGTAALDGYLHDTFRHQLLPPALFIGLTFGVLTRHTEWWVLLAGLVGAAFSSRIVGGLADQVALEGLVKRLKTLQPAAACTAENFAGTLEGVRARLLPDFAQMNWLTVAVLLDVAQLRPAHKSWLAVDCVFIFLAAAQLILKGGGFVLLWRRGVSARVEQLANEIESVRRGNDSGGGKS